MSTYIDNHNKQEHLDRAYRKYEPQYNAAFASDPSPAHRKYDAMAPLDDPQWKRLEAYRGNDKDAYHAHRDHPGDPLAVPTAKEAAMWEANQADHWRVEREPGYADHAMSHNKWLAMSPEQRHSDRAAAFFDHVEAQHGAGYDQYATKAGNNAVTKDAYLNNMAVVEYEKMAARSQQQQQAPKQEAAQQSAPKQATPQQEAKPTRLNSAAFQEAPNQEQAAPAAEQQAEVAQESKKSRMSLADFQGSTSEYVAQRRPEIVAKSDDEIKQTKQEAAAEHRKLELGEVQDQAAKVDGYNRVQSSLDEVRTARRQASLAEAQDRNRGQDR